MRYGLIGEHLSHSFSKIIHEKFRIADYELKELSSEEIESFFKKKDFFGINVTIPYKEKVIPYLDFVSTEALKIGAVNTVVNRNGKLYGYNTDVDGFKALIDNLNINVTGKKVLILGTGGTSKTASYVFNYLNAKVLKVSRNKMGDNIITYEEVYSNHLDADIIVNTTPCGMYPNIYDLVIDLRRFNKLEAVIDVVYNPLDTMLIKLAKSLNIKAIGGLYMLVKQASVAEEKMLDVSITTCEVEHVYKDIKKTKENIVLVGMPSSGKSTIGAILANKLNKELIDTDLLIEERIKMPISKFLNENNVAYFRKLEKEIIKEVAKKSGIIISTGGGVILDKENVFLLKLNGKIFFLDRKLEHLLATSSRPLTKTKIQLEKVYNERISLYNEAADSIIDNNLSIDIAVDKILEEINK